MKNQNNNFTLSDRLEKNEKIDNNIIAKEANIYYKSKSNTLSEIYYNINRSSDFYSKTTTKFYLGKSEDKSQKNINNQINNINSIKKEKLSKNIYQYLFANDKKQKIRKIILSKRKILEEIFKEDTKNTNIEKNNSNNINKNNNNNINNNNNNHRRNKGIILINNVSIPEIENNKKNIYKIDDNYCNNSINIKNIDKNNQKILQEKLYQIKMNKIALFKKIKFAELKKFCCKDIKFNGYNKKYGINYNLEQNNKNNKNFNNKNFKKNELKNVNNCHEITINIIREKVRNYFIGKFESIKEYFYDWDEQGIGKININDIYKYLNNKIKYKISKDEIKRIFSLYYKKKFFDLENFKYFFFEDPNEKLSIKFNKFYEYNQKLKYLVKNSSDEHLLFSKRKNEDNNNNSNNISNYENKYYNELLNLIKKEKNKIISEIKNRKEDDFDYNDFYNLINKYIPENKKIIYDNEIKIIFNNNKINNSEKININLFFEKLKEQKDENKNNAINKKHINIKKEINQGYSTFYAKNMNNKIFRNNRNMNMNKNKNKNNIIIKKDNFFNKTNNLFNNQGKEIEENKINKNNSLNNYLRQSKNNEIIKTEKNKASLSCINFKNKQNDFNDKLTITHDNTVKLQNSYQLFPRLKKYQLSKITKYSREKNKNTDIIDLL